MNWINGKEKKWSCEHVNKCDVLVEQDNELFIYCTDYSELKGDYKYIFMNDLLDDYCKNNRGYIACDCKKVIEKENNWPCGCSCDCIEKDGFFQERDGTVCCHDCG